MDLISLGPYINMGQNRWTSFHWVLTSIWARTYGLHFMDLYINMGQNIWTSFHWVLTSIWARTCGPHFIGSLHQYGPEHMDLISLGPYINMGQKRWTSFHWVLTSKLWSKYFAVWTSQLVNKSKVKCLWKQPVHLYDNEYVTRRQNIPVCYNQAGNFNLLPFMKIYGQTYNL